jgi:hypothetical protein
VILTADMIPGKQEFATHGREACGLPEERRCAYTRLNPNLAFTPEFKDPEAVAEAAE